MAKQSLPKESSNFKICSKPECTQECELRGMCRNHYNQWLKSKDTRTCKLDGCLRVWWAAGYCHRHYDRWRKHGDPYWEKGSHGWGGTYEEKFWSRVAVLEDKNACWEWQGGRDKWGYGSIKLRGLLTGVHRIAYELATGIVPQLFILHSCDNPPCCNPQHLREGTNRENAQDKVDRNTALKSHCRRGHPYTEENVWRWARNPRNRHCRQCWAVREQIKREKRAVKERI